MLTRKQHDLLTFINGRLSVYGVAPSFDEMKDALNLKSKSGIHRLITALEERGFIRRLPHRARALEILRLPDQVAATVAEPVAVDKGFSPNVIEGGFQTEIGDSAHQAIVDTETYSVPLLGKIAAGTPIEALQDNTNNVVVPGSMLGDGEYFALEIEGDSMVDAGILDGDTAVIRRCDLAENGAIVVALVDENEATLKRLRKKGGTVALEPANAAYETRIFGPDRIRIQGRLAGIVRTY